VKRIDNFPILVCERFAEALNIEYAPATLYSFVAEGVQPLVYTAEELLPHLNEVGSALNLTFVEHSLPEKRLGDLLNNAVLPVLVFPQGNENVPMLVCEIRRKDIRVLQFTPLGEVEKWIGIGELHLLLAASCAASEGRLTFVAPYHVQPILSDETAHEPPSPLQRFWRLLMTDRRDLFLVLIYAGAIGLLSLSAPVGVQAIIGMISGGLVLQPVILLIVFVVIATFFAGLFQILQMRVVEILQQRLFTRGAFEMAFRIPRVRLESIDKYYAPELMNRFFDILTIQKGISKLLTEFTTSLLSVVFGLLLLSFYHPFFVFFDIVLVAVVFLIFRISGPKGLRTSLRESDYKYKVAHWLEDLARTMTSFKMAGFTNLAMERIDDNVTHYLKQRKEHFRVLVGQYTSLLLFKTAVTAIVLALGTILVVDRQITLGQFVAAEIVIILVLSGIEKIIKSLDTIYDLLTAVEKVGKVTDLPLDTNRGIVISHTVPTGARVEAIGLSYAYPYSSDNVLEGVTFSILPGQRVAIVGRPDAGRSTLFRILTGILFDYKGAIELDGMLLRDINPASLRDQVGECLSADALFEGTVAENITVGKLRISMEDIQWAARSAGLTDFLRRLPDGLHTQVVAGGKQFSATFIRRIILARALAERPRLLVLDDGYLPNDAFTNDVFVPFLFDRSYPWTVMAATTHPGYLESADQIILMDGGKVLATGTLKDIGNHPEFLRILHELSGGASRNANDN
jgi:ABC-type bacteriocin/lantibiotic exporter with double-glycine peptidase domain